MTKIRVALTAGDIDGIGFEVTAKALNFLGPQRNTQFFLWRSNSAEARYLRLIDKRWKRITLSSFEEGLKTAGSHLIDIASPQPPPVWVEEAARACVRGALDGMVTAPLSKTGIIEAGLRDLGHTDILKRVTRAKSVNMGFVGKHFNVVLATAHIPLGGVSKSLSIKALTEGLMAANRLRLSLSLPLRERPIGVLGLNPHSGEGGLIGTEELTLFPGLKAFAKLHRVPIVGPLVPDAAFFKENWGRYSVFLAMYHDQGLIPFKMVHGQDSGVHVSLGIPIVRTSVDHGTAKSLFGLNKANPNSMIDAIRWAIKLARL